jgi:hypothetical protein
VLQLSQGADSGLEAMLLLKSFTWSMRLGTEKFQGGTMLESVVAPPTVKLKENVSEVLYWEVKKPMQFSLSLMSGREALDCREGL